MKLIVVVLLILAALYWVKANIDSANAPPPRSGCEVVDHSMFQGGASIECPKP